MTAIGKITTTAITNKTHLKPGSVRILVTQHPQTGALSVATNKTGAVAVMVTATATVAGSRQCRYQLQTSAGTLIAAPSQTHWLARDKDRDALPASAFDETIRAESVTRHTAEEIEAAALATGGSSLGVAQQPEPVLIASNHAPADQGRFTIQVDRRGSTSGAENAYRLHMTAVELANTTRHTLGGYARVRVWEGFDADTTTTPAADANHAPVLVENVTEVVAWRSAVSPATGETFEHQASTDGGKTWRTVAVGLETSDVDAYRAANPAGEGMSYRYMAEDGRGAPTQRPEPADGFGPVDAVYTPGDRVNIQRGYGGRPSVGIIVDVDIPVFKDRRAQQPWDTAYTVRIPVTGEVYVDTTTMRRELPVEIGQTWTSTRSDGIPSAMTIGSIEPDGLIVNGVDYRPRGIALSSYDWAQVTSGPHPHGSNVKRCDIGGEELTGPYWLLHGYGRGWEGDRGAACAYHTGQPEPEVVPDAGPAPRDGYARYVEAAAESHADAAFASPWASV